VTFLALTVWQWLLLFGGTAAVVAALYLLRLARRRAVVPFSPLWDEVLDAERRRNPFRRLRRLLSLLIQVLVLALVTLALADPRLGDASVARDLVLVIDASASMQTLDGPDRTRFDRALADARRLVTDLRAGQSALIISAETSPRLVCRRTADARALLDALAALTPTDGRADLPAALRLACDADPTAHIVFFTDAGGRNMGSDPLMSFPGGLTPFSDLRRGRQPTAADGVEVRLFSQSADNAALTAFDARPSVADPFRTAVFVQATSFAVAPLSGTLRLFAGDQAAPFEVLPLSLEPGAVWQRTLGAGLAAIPPGPLRAELDLPDALAADNRAYAFLPPPPILTVDLVSDTPDFFLLKALRAHPLVTVRTTPPAQYQHDAGHVPIFLRCVPPTVPAGSAVYIDPPAARSPVPVARSLDRAPITAVAADHPLLRHVQLNDLVAAPALAFQTRAGDAVLARSLDDAVMLTRPTPGGRMLLIGFDPAASDLPLRVAYPVLIANALSWLRGQAVSADRRAFRVGEPIPLPDAPDAAALFLTASLSAGTPVDVAGQSCLVPRRIGFYCLSTAATSRTIAVNVVDASESDLRTEVATPDARSAEGGTSGDSDSSPAERSRRASALWSWLVLAVVLLLVLEWWSYHRRWTV
jgi:hypothetical protein